MGGREQVLFGNCAQLAHEALVRSLVGDGFTHVWFEVPLTGAPRFDVHVAFSRKCLRSGSFLAGAGNGYDELFRWYAQVETGGNGLAFAYDVSEGTIDNPAVHVNVNKSPLDDVDRFFELSGRAGAAACYRAFAKRLPNDWNVWYMGVHPGRPGVPVRVDCSVNRRRREDYAADLRLFEMDLRACGFEADLTALPDLAGVLLASPYQIELQFDVLEGGRVGPTLGLSAALGLCAAGHLRRLFDEGGDIAAMLGRVERLGLTDSRWHSVREALYAKAVPYRDALLTMYCLPTFFKLRMRDGRALDAKFYLQAAALELPTTTGCGSA